MYIYAYIYIYIYIYVMYTYAKSGKADTVTTKHCKLKSILFFHSILDMINMSSTHCFGNDLL